jgi:hypothetical protein
MYFPRNWGFSSALSKLWNFGGVGVVEPPETPPVRHWFRKSDALQLSVKKDGKTGTEFGALNLILGQILYLNSR